jgi:hypothetical protein
MVAGLQRAFSMGGDRSVSHIVGIWEEVGVGGGGGAGGGQKQRQRRHVVLVQRYGTDIRFQRRTGASPNALQAVECYK